MSPTPTLAAGAGLLVMPVVAVTVFLGSGAADPPASSCGGTPLLGWASVYRHDFTDLRAVSAYQSSPQDNARLRADDVDNKPLQHPTVSGNVSLEADPAAEDGAALAVWTQPGSFALPGGAAQGWTNGRIGIAGHDQAPPVRVRARLRMTASVGTKSAVMWWPAGGGWPWEVDFAETFGGDTLTDAWGARQRVDQRWHADLDGDGEADEQLTREYHLDATGYHLYDLIVLPDRMSVEIDGVEVLATTDRRFIPTGPGFFSIGKALTGRRELPGRTPDAVIVDWLEIHRPAAQPGDPTGDHRRPHRRRRRPAGRVGAERVGAGQRHQHLSRRRGASGTPGRLQQHARRPGRGGCRRR